MNAKLIELLAEAISSDVAMDAEHWAMWVRDTREACKAYLSEQEANGVDTGMNCSLSLLRDAIDVPC